LWEMTVQTKTLSQQGFTPPFLPQARHALECHTVKSGMIPDDPIQVSEKEP
jgi:hypothetical protein